MIRNTIEIATILFGIIMFCVSIFKISRAQYSSEDYSRSKWTLYFLAITGIFVVAEGVLRFMAYTVAANMAKAVYSISLGILLITLARSLPPQKRNRYLLIMSGGIGLIIIGLLFIAIEIADLLGYKTP